MFCDKIYKKSLNYVLTVLIKSISKLYNDKFKKLDIF